MSQFGCLCGATIYDVEGPNEVTGRILSDKSSDKFFTDLCSIIEDCVEHDKRGDLGGWRKKYFNHFYPKDLPISEMLHDVIHTLHVNLTLDMMECDECGRLWIQEGVGKRKYQEYIPGSQDRKKVLGFNQDEEQR